MKNRTLIKLERSHLNALPILLDPLINAKEKAIGLSFFEICKILEDWDKARVLK